MKRTKTQFRRSIRSLSSSRRSSMLDLDVSTGQMTHRTSRSGTRDRMKFNHSGSGFRYSYSGSKLKNIHSGYNGSDHSLLNSNERTLNNQSQNVSHK